VSLEGGDQRVEGNVVYGNGVGMEAGYSAQGWVTNNVVYENTNQALRISQTRGSPLRIVNNTFVQPVGDAVRMDSGSTNVFLRNNIFWIGAGYAIYASDASSQSGFNSDYNLFYTRPDEPNAHVAFWNGAIRDSLSDWQAASGQDAHSLDSDPLFLDPDGADNILGYEAMTGIDGGLDDNYYVFKGSPAIDSGSTWEGIWTDAFGAAREDDPGTPNTGSTDYEEVGLSSNLFAAGGIAQNWRSTGYWTYTLPFAFPFYGVNYTQVYVSARGFIQFGSATNASDNSNSSDKLAANIRIAPLWDDLSTTGAGDDIFVDTTVAGRVTIRWNATLSANRNDAQFAATLFSDGRIQFHYGTGNTGLTPTIGISRGDGFFIKLSRYDAATSLSQVNSVEWRLTDRSRSIVDLGAYEFRGSSLDVVPLTIVGSNPAAVLLQGDTGDCVSGIEILFSEEPNPIDSLAASNFDLREAGTNGLFGDSDDTIIPIEPRFSLGSNRVILHILSGCLRPGHYRLTVAGITSVHDLSGLKLDGDGNGTGGDDFVRFFTVSYPGPTVQSITVEPGRSQRSRVSTVAIAFNADVGASLDIADFQLRNSDTGQLVSLSSARVTFDPVTFVAELHLPQLEDGNYRLTILKADVRDTGGNGLLTPASTDFFVLAGDHNADRVTNDLDLYSVWQNLLKPAAQRDPNADLDGDGTVTMADLDLVRNNYLALLPASAVASLAASAYPLPENRTAVTGATLLAPAPSLLLTAEPSRRPGWGLGLLATYSWTCCPAPVWWSAQATSNRPRLLESDQGNLASLPNWARALCRKPDHLRTLTWAREADVRRPSPPFS
jgi:hypothetical protein